jgi:hypothetical protein
MLYVVCYDVTSHTSLLSLRYTSVADYYSACRHIVVHFSAVEPNAGLSQVAKAAAQHVCRCGRVSCHLLRHFHYVTRHFYFIRVPCYRWSIQPQVFNYWLNTVTILHPYILILFTNLTSVFLSDMYTTPLTNSTSLVLHLYMVIRKINRMNECVRCSYSSVVPSEFYLHVPLLIVTNC